MIPQVQANAMPAVLNTAQAEGSSTQLSSTDRQFLQNEMANIFSMSPEAASEVLESLPAGVLKSVLPKIRGEEGLSAREIQDTFGLADSEINELMGGQEQVGRQIRGTYNNPFGDAFLVLMMITRELMADVKMSHVDLVRSQVDLAKKAADERKTGAMGQFIMAMGAAGASIACGGMHYAKSKSQKPENESRNGLDRLGDYTGVMGANLITQPLTAGGEFINQSFQYKAALLDADGQEAQAFTQQLTSLASSIADSERSMASGL